MNRDVCEHFNPVDLPCDKCKPVQQEPYAWMAYDDAYMARRVAWNQEGKDAAGGGLYWEPLYARPPRRKWQGLTEEELHGIWSSGPEMMDYARAIEAAPKEKNQ